MGLVVANPISSTKIADTPLPILAWAIVIQLAAGGVMRVLRGNEE